MSGHQIDPTLYRDRDAVPVRRALISVSDKTGLLDLAEALAEAGVEIVSTGSTASRRAARLALARAARPTCAQSGPVAARRPRQAAYRTPTQPGRAPSSADDRHT